MSKAAIRTVTIEAANRKDAERQLREALGDNFPEEILQSLLSRIDEDEDEPAGEGFVVPEINSREDLLAAAEAVAELPAHQQHEAMEAVVLKLAESMGIDPEKATVIANAAKQRVFDLFETLGMRIPEQHKRAFGDTTARDADVKPSPKTGPEAPLTEKEKEEVRDGFKQAMAKLKAAGYSDPAICHIGQYFKAQDALVDALQAIFHLADSERDHQHVPSAILFQQITDYIRQSSEMVYGMLKHAGVDPDSIGFVSYEQYLEKRRKTAHIEERVSRTLAPLKRAGVQL